MIDDELPVPLHRFKHKPLPAVYNCIAYRSRSEARWAVFLDALGVPFEYEPEGFNLGDHVNYLPDFWLPSLRIWLEIKGPEPTDYETEKALRLAHATDSPVFVFWGGITAPDSEQGSPKAYAFMPDLCADEGYQWCECPDCGLLGITFEGRSDRLACKTGYLDAMVACGRVKIPLSAPKPGCPRHGGNLDRHCNTGSPRLVAAYTAARSMRFGR